MAIFASQFDSEAIKFINKTKSIVSIRRTIGDFNMYTMDRWCKRNPNVEKWRTGLEEDEERENPFSFDFRFCYDLN